jgi:hypothetical protein
MHVPGRWLLAIARVVFDDSVLATVVQQTIADLQVEWLAGASTAERLRARWRGYLAFWSIVALSPAIFSGWPGQRMNRRAFWQVTGFVIAATIAAVAWRTTVSELLAPVLNNLPEGTMGQIARAGSFAFLASPVAVAIAILAGRFKGRGPFASSVPAVTFLSLLSIPIAALVGTAGIIGTFEGIGRSGSAGLGIVAQGIVSATSPMFLAVVAVIIALLASAVLAARSHPVAASESIARGSRRRAIVVSLVLVVGLIGVDQLLRQQHELLNRLLTLLDVPPKVSPQTGAQALEQAVSMVLFGSVVLTIAFVAAGLSMWRGSPVGAIDPIVKWSSRAALIVAIVGCLWHATIIRSDLEAFRTLFVQQAAQGRPTR